MESDQLACGFSQQIELLQICKPTWPYQIWGVANLRCHNPTVQSLLFHILTESFPTKLFYSLRLGQNMLQHSNHLPVWCCRHLKKVIYYLIFSPFFHFSYTWRKHPAQARNKGYLDRDIIIPYITLIVLTWKREEGEIKKKLVCCRAISTAPESIDSSPRCLVLDSLSSQGSLVAPARRMLAFAAIEPYCASFYVKKNTEWK
jgi:hypothetical protein